MSTYFISLAAGLAGGAALAKGDYFAAAGWIAMIALTVTVSKSGEQRP